MSLGNIEGVIEGAYAAILDPSRWSDVAQTYASLLGSTKVALHAPPTGGAMGSIFVAHGIDPTPVIDRIHIYGRQSPIAERAVRMGLAPGVFIHSDVIPDDEYRRSDYYLNYAHPTGCHQGLQAILRVGHDEDAPRVALTVARTDTEAPYGEAELAIARALFPHLRRAVSLALDVNPQRALDPAFGQTLDGFETPCCLLGDGGRLIFANAAARDVLTDGGALREHATKLKARDPSVSAELDRALAKACDVSARWSIRGCAEVLLPQGNRLPMVAVVVPLGDDNPLMHVGPLRAAVYLLDTEGSATKAPDLRRLRQLFALTQAEAEITGSLVQGLSVAEIAERRSVSVSTVRTQIKLILDKTQSSRQAHLMRLHRLFAVRSPDARL